MQVKVLINRCSVTVRRCCVKRLFSHLSSVCRVDESADSAHFLLARLDFAHAKCQVNQNLSAEALREPSAVRWLQIMCFLCGEKRGIVFSLLFPGYVTLFKMDPQNFPLLITAAIVWAVYQANIKNGTFENASRQRPASGEETCTLLQKSCSLAQQRTALAGPGSDGIQSTDCSHHSSGSGTETPSSERSPFWCQRVRVKTPSDEKSKQRLLSPVSTRTAT